MGRNKKKTDKAAARKKNDVPGSVPAARLAGFCPLSRGIVDADYRSVSGMWQRVAAW